MLSHSLKGIIAKRIHRYDRRRPKHCNICRYDVFSNETDMWRTRIDVTITLTFEEATKNLKQQEKEENALQPPSNMPLYVLLR